MRFYLAKNKAISLENVSNFDDYTEDGHCFDHLALFASSPETTDIQPVWGTQDEAEKCSKLKTILENFCRSKNTGKLDSEVYLRVGVGSTRDEMEMRTHDPGFIGLELCNDSNPWSNIMACLWHVSEKNVTFQVEIQHNGSSIITTEMTMTKHFRSPVPTKCKDYQIKIPVNWNLARNPIYLTITATIPDEVLDGTQQKGGNNLLHFKNLLDRQTFWDVLIVSNDGTPFKAHKVFLACQSTVFEGMFTAEMKESQEARVELPDLCAQNLDAFLRYLYYGDDQTIKEGNVEQILELYQAAHKYHVENLEKLLVQTILSKPMNWFELNGTVKLYAFSRNVVPVNTDLQAKILQVFKRFAMQIMDCPAYQELFRTNPVAAMELCQMSLMLK